MLDRLRNMLKSMTGNVASEHQTFSGDTEAGALDPESVKQLVRSVLTTHPHEIGCDECIRQVDRFVELRLAGKNAAEAMPLVQDHLHRCRDCREEFEALQVALAGLK